MRRRLRADLDERGAVLVEAVIIVPIIILLTFGAIELGFAYNEQGTVRAATRTAARAASTQSKASWMDVGNAAVTTLNTSATNLNNGEPTIALVYNAEVGTPTSLSSCNVDCAAYVWNESSKKFVVDGGHGDPWLPQERNACAGESDKISVFMAVEHDWLTGLPFTGSGSVTLTAKTVMALEPVADQAACGSTL